MTARDLLAISRAAEEFPDGIALRTPSRDWIFREAARRARAFLSDIDRPPEGRPFVITADPTEETVFAMLGLLEAGIPALVLHPKLAAPERHRLLAAADAIDAPLPAGTAFVLFTSGTTGMPKPAMLPREALLASARMSAQGLPLAPGDVWTLQLSPARVGGLSILTRCLAARAAAALCPKFEPQTYIDWMRASRATVTSLVPTMLSKVLREARPGVTPPDCLRAVLLGGSEASRRLLSLAHRMQVPVIATYGMTETCSNVATTPWADRLHPDRMGTLRPNPGVRLRISPEGVIEVLTPTLMSGYWGREPVNRSAWFSTGDLGRLHSDGTLTLLSRRSDLFQTGGENLYPLEVEKGLVDIPGVRQALVGGIPDETWGRIVCALLVPEDGGQPLSDDELAREARARLSAYKCPRRIAWVREIPVTAGGKPDRSARVFERTDWRVLHYSDAAGAR